MLWIQISFIITLSLLSVVCFLIAAQEIKLSNHVALADIPSSAYQLIGWAMLLSSSLFSISAFGWLQGVILALLMFTAAGFILTMPARISSPSSDFEA